jgi:tocopherol cyclase
MQAVFQDIVEEGFQATETFHQGCIIDSPGTCPGSLPADVPFAYWSFAVQPVYGWGNAGEQQQSTAGWLAALPVFEPHWQVLLAHGLANGYIQWGPDRRISLDNSPVYCEKTWGQGFPKKWTWVQCNTFKGQPHLSLTAVCAKRSLVTPTFEEKLGMIGIHYKGSFIEVVPWKGPMRWDVDTWGRWHFWGKTDEYEVLVEAYCDQSAGVILRAPMGKEGLAPACKDTFAGAWQVLFASDAQPWCLKMHCLHAFHIAHNTGNN